MTPQNKLWSRLRSLIDFVEHQIGKSLQAQHALGISEFRALEMLAATDGAELRMQDLAAALGLNQSSITRLVERLERGQYTFRDVCSGDKRGVYAVLTDSGRAKYEAARDDYEQALSDSLESFSETPGNKRIVAAVKKLTTSIS